MDYPVNILLVDDRPDEYTSIAALLADKPYQLLGASSGLLALKALLENEVALIIMDVLMPDMNGFETARRIKMRKKSQDIPIIFLTALNSELQDYMKAYSAGAIDYLTKPFQPDILRSKIDGFVSLYKARKELQIKSDQLQQRTSELEASNRALTELKEKAEVALRIKSGFLSMISHEIRTPMNGILSMSEMLLEAELKPQDRRTAEIIHRSGRGLLSVVNQILEYSKMESGKMELDYRPFEVEECLGETLDLFRGLALEKNLSLESYLDPSVPAVLEGDSNRLRQILINLIGNAIKFTESGGVKIYVNKRDETEQTVQLEFVVEDSGIGIPQEKMDELFQPFIQLQTPFASKQEGTGLGLSISKTLVELMGGTIYATSQVGDGTMFIFTMIAALPAGNRAAGSA
ncbi:MULTISPECIES: ATP-binding protein [unclassified Paenibacillus]|uniref:ATP-binding response regulator n=1 Tax=unclassified Paenibacillus TaxID=185978 RepID=UPI0009549245|nr:MULTISPECIES: ATP-binding protein [unclassified Paenibacillus]ASS68357.1 response regulator [Paenibacillus sp. RUD330]SIR30237.1 Signal transduction histidine kinase [Paenibacillus sp. RU4X]SIR42100.1 Signal transduction histidine kinase [Paenibacillus sp. RU4T]